jgi:hypothetical protein
LGIYRRCAPRISIDAVTIVSDERYLAQLDTAGLQGSSEALAAKTAHLKEKLAKIESEMQDRALPPCNGNRCGLRCFRRLATSVDAESTSVSIGLNS